MKNFPRAVLLFQIIRLPHHKGRVHTAVLIDGIPLLNGAYKRRISVDSGFHVQNLDFATLKIAKRGIERPCRFACAYAGIRGSVELDCFFRPVFRAVSAGKRRRNATDNVFRHDFVIHQNASVRYVNC